ncbi:hypothetical protein WL93_02755 [Burkholderia diffusa]|nr:hypothetical protein [Burkholderia diffusa]KVC43383.1 hypothetical protein WI71_23320 [Burkholderia diffusa]KWF98159.1 hypothetical protein WL93_02755 [Burkholderia diffusa]
MSKDAIGLQGGINVYQYAPKPVQWTDPFISLGPDGHRLDWLTYGSGHVHGLMLDGRPVANFEDGQATTRAVAHRQARIQNRC